MGRVDGYNLQGAHGQRTTAVHVLPEGASITRWNSSMEELLSVGIEDPS
jgi:hypothetical protein